MENYSMGTGSLQGKLCDGIGFGPAAAEGILLHADRHIVTLLLGMAKTFQTAKDAGIQAYGTQEQEKSCQKS